MRDYQCLDCKHEFKENHEVFVCPECRSDNYKRLWPKAINMNGNGYKNNFEGNN
jgi:Zn finger protein HypA/HybF involved in hydrogenase expression